MTAERPRVSGAQLRAARALLNWSAENLANAAGVSRGVVQRAELEREKEPVLPENVERIVEALEGRGIIFLPGNGEGPGVRLRKRRR